MPKEETCDFGYCDGSGYILCEGFREGKLDQWEERCVCNPKLEGEIEAEQDVE